MQAKFQQTPFAKAYGVDNVKAQAALATAAIVLLDHAHADLLQVGMLDELDHLAMHAGTREASRTALAFRCSPRTVASITR
jgi:hypothetical protein